MPVHEQRQHFRIDDQVYFEYKVLKPGNCYSDQLVSEDLLNHGEMRYLETMQYFQSLDYELAELTQALAMQEPAIAHYLNLINAKIDCLVRNLIIGDKSHLHKVTISLGGMSFRSKEKIKEKTHMKIILYTKPKMVPVVMDAIVVYSKYISTAHHRTAVKFEHLTTEQERLLSQHIMLAQVPCQ